MLMRGITGASTLRCLKLPSFLELQHHVRGLVCIHDHAPWQLVQCPRTFYTDLDTLICKSEQPLSPNTLCV
jgi:hypothetical protein